MHSIIMVHNYPINVAITPRAACGCRLTSVNRGPNIYTVDDFLTSGEVDHLLELITANKRRYSHLQHFVLNFPGMLL